MGSQDSTARYRYRELSDSTCRQKPGSEFVSRRFSNDKFPASSVVAALGLMGCTWLTFYMWSPSFLDGDFPRPFWYVPGFVFLVGLLGNVVYAHFAPGRFLDFPMAASCCTIILPGMTLWAHGYPTGGMICAYASTASTAADAMRPYSDGDRNRRSYAFDMTMCAGCFGSCMVPMARAFQCAFAQLHIALACGFVLWIVIVFSIPVAYWYWVAVNYYSTEYDLQNQSARTRGELTGEAWRPFHIGWHLLAVLCFMVGFISAIGVCAI
jgi:hypothetical protein